MDAKFLRMLADNAQIEAEEHINTSIRATENGDEGVAIASAAAGAVMASLVAIFSNTADQLAKEPK